MKINDLTGRVFGRLNVVALGAKRGRMNCWSCLCECGTVKDIAACSLMSGATLSCGCLRRELSIEQGRRLGESLRHQYPHARKLQAVLSSMKQRCANPNDPRYKTYGARGITVCDEWRKDHHKFYQWATENGYAPGLEIDRRDVNLGYSPANCRFITAFEQASNKTNNRVIVWNGEALTLAQLARLTVVPYKRLHARLAAGWTLERAASP